jgi:hypothetical protein
MQLTRVLLSLAACVLSTGAFVSPLASTAAVTKTNKIAMHHRGDSEKLSPPVADENGDKPFKKALLVRGGGSDFGGKVSYYNKLRAPAVAFCFPAV